MLSILVFVVGIAATLLALLYQVQLAQNQVKLVQAGLKTSVLPCMGIYTQCSYAVSFSLGIVSNGLGPAFIEDIAIRYRERPTPPFTEINGS